jgi:Excalibur calcium-binding domain
MKRLILIVLLGLLAWQGYAKYQSNRAARAVSQGGAEAADRSRSPAPERESTPAGQYKCDGRTRCSQMTSCAEATFFLKNCPGVKMDGNNDGVPCEKQWCK